MASVAWSRLGGVVLMAGAPAVFWAYAAKFTFGLFGVVLSATALAAIVCSIFLFVGCIVAGLALKS